MHNILTVNNKIPIRCNTVFLTVQQFIDLLRAYELLTDGLIFIGSISQIILTLPCRGVVQILGLTVEDIEKSLERVNKKILQNEGV